MKTRQNTFSVLLTLMASLAFTACGTFQIGLATPTPPTRPTANEAGTDPASESPPAGVLVARDAALEHLRAEVGSTAPAASLAWEVTDTTPENLLGAGAYTFNSPGWTVTVSYPIVAPEAVIYDVVVVSEPEDVEWACKVDALGAIIDTSNPGTGTPVIGWLGHVVSLPAGSPYEDYLSLSPEGTGEIGLVGASPEMDAEIQALRDKPEPGKYANFWGTLTCGVDDYNGCQLVVDHVRHGATATDPEPVNGWEGTLTTTTFNSGLSYVFVLEGDFPVWHSIHSNDPQVLAQLVSLADTGAIVQVWGEFMTGVPDVNGTRIQAERIEVLSPGDGAPASTAVDIPAAPANWGTYTNATYGYRFQHPTSALITDHGPEGFPTEELPAGMTPDEYMTQLRAELSDQLCVEIKYQLGVIYIAAPPNQEKFYTPCGRTGVGAGTLIDQVLMVEINGQTIKATGFEFLGGSETLDLHQDWFSVTLPDGTRIQFGSLPRTDATYDDYRLKTREVLLQILKSYKTIN